MSELEQWLKKVNDAKDSVAIFRILDDFRDGDWSDDERAKMSKNYVAALARLKSVEFEPVAKSMSEETDEGLPTDPENLVGSLSAEEEVWYEKM